MDEFEDARKKLDDINKKILTDKNMSTSDIRIIAMDKRNKNPKWKKNVEKAGGKRAKDPNWSKNLYTSNTDPIKRAKTSKSLMGEKHPRYMGKVIGTNVDSGLVEYEFIGATEIKNAGLSYGVIAECIRGIRKTYKKCIWHRESVEK